MWIIRQFRNQLYDQEDYYKRSFFTLLLRNKIFDWECNGESKLSELLFLPDLSPSALDDTSTVQCSWSELHDGKIFSNNIHYNDSFRSLIPKSLPPENEDPEIRAAIQDDEKVGEVDE